MTHFYVINLNVSKDRWSKFISSPVYSNRLFTRIEAIDGRLACEENYIEFDVHKFQKYNGRHPKPGEYGCYLSHVKALRNFQDSSHSTAIILEDDIEIAEEQIEFCKYFDRLDTKKPLMVRLETNRKPAFESLLTTPAGFKIGQCWFGPTGGAAAYWINRPGVEKLLKSMTPGFLPVDVWLEQTWNHGVPTFLTKPSVFPHPTPPYSEIGQTSGKKYNKYDPMKRLPTLNYRTIQLVYRLIQCMKTRSFKK